MNELLKDFLKKRMSYGEREAVRQLRREWRLSRGKRQNLAVLTAPQGNETGPTVLAGAAGQAEPWVWSHAERRLGEC